MMSSRQIAFLSQDLARGGDAEAHGMLLTAWFCALMREQLGGARLTSPQTVRVEHDTIMEAA